MQKTATDPVLTKVPVPARLIRLFLLRDRAIRHCEEVVEKLHEVKGEDEDGRRNAELAADYDLNSPVREVLHELVELETEDVSGERN